MGTAAQHQQKAEHHLRFLGAIADDYSDWLATVAFYAAVELIERLLSDRGRHSKNHEDRNNAVRRDYQNIHKAFKALYNASLDARYESLEHSLPAAEVRKELIEKRLAHIQSFVASHSQPLPAPPST
jgi:hypothetical protein